MNKSFKKRTMYPMLLSILAGYLSVAQAENIEEIIVNSDFREAELQEISASISVVGSDVINQRNSRHLEDIIALIPNSNYAAGASRGRYFQIRGIGERSQFVAPLNPSVGTYVDGIDFTGFGGAATLIDIDQVEVLRGSQGTRFGANALAGVINLKTNEPSVENKGYIKTQVGSYQSLGVESAIGGALTDSVLYRAAIGRTIADGFIENTTVNKKDTNNIDELTSRIKLRWLASENLTVDFTALHLDIDNGYDAFSLDANRKTMSDQPGHDRQKTNAFAVNSDWNISDALSMRTIVTSNRTDAEYGYDEDWTGPDLQPDYQAFDNYLRDIARDSAEIRWLSGPEGQIAGSDWLLGIYYQKSTIGLTRDYDGFWGEYDISELFNSDYKTSSTSLFVQSNTPIKDKLALTSGLRFENWKSDYTDSNTISGKNDENLFGGKLALELTTDLDDLLYISLTRGYKAGGYNGEVNLPSESLRRFDTEYQWNYEVGGKFYSPDGNLTNHITAFYTDRKDLQLKSSTAVTNEGGATSFIDYTANAGEGVSYGVEWQMDWQPVADLRVSTSLGLLKTKITQHTNPDVDAFNLQGRAAAHAPEYNFATSANYAFNEKLSITLEVEGKDKFYYSDSHNYQSQAYTLINARLAYATHNYKISAFINNVANKDYGVRGFAGWDADPREGDGYDETEFQQLGAPRVIGISARANF
jgi:iron complex outermembrane receptor protein